MSKLNGMRDQAHREGLKVKVAILGAGRIAQSMAATLTGMAADPRYADLIEPYAVAARDGERAADFAAQHGLARSFGSYEAMLEDPDVDLVYIATPHNLHAEQASACLKAGKNVLVEKAFTANAAQAHELLAVAEGSGLLCTEAIWTRYMPSRALIDQVIDSGEIGEVKAASANLCYPVSDKPRLNDPALAGGALLDVGVYPLNFLDMAIGASHGRTIERVETTMIPFATGVDAHNSTTLVYDDGTMGVATSSMLVASDRSGAIWGTEGYLVCENINNVQWIDVFDGDHRRTRHIEVPEQITGYEYEVAAAANAILDGAEECAEMPHADSLRIMELTDRIRAAWPLTYPFEH